MTAKIKVPKRGNVLQDIGRQGQEFLQGFEERKQKKIENERKDRLEAAQERQRKDAAHHNAELRRLQQERNDLATAEAHADREEERRLRNEERLREKAAGIQRREGKTPGVSPGVIPSETLAFDQEGGLAGAPIPSIERPAPPAGDIVVQELIATEGLDPSKAEALAHGAEQESFGEQRAGEQADLKIEAFKQALTPQVLDVLATLGKNDVSGLGFRSLPFEDQLKQAQQVIDSGAADEPKPINLEDPADIKSILDGWIQAILAGKMTLEDLQANADISPEEFQYVRERTGPQRKSIAEQLGAPPPDAKTGLEQLRAGETPGLQQGLNEARQRRVAGAVGPERR